MKDIVEFAEEKKIINRHNRILIKSFKSKTKQDRTIKIITKEVSDFVLKLLKKKNNNVN